jgi:hypothetical protein
MQYSGNASFARVGFPSCRDDQSTWAPDGTQRPVGAHALSTGPIALRPQDAIGIAMRPLDIGHTPGGDEIIDNDKDVLRLKRDFFQRIPCARPRGWKISGIHRRAKVLLCERREFRLCNASWAGEVKREVSCTKRRAIDCREQREHHSQSPIAADRASLGCHLRRLRSCRGQWRRSL